MRVRCLLREIRGPRTMTAVAKAAGINLGALSRIEQGVALPKDAQIPALEAAYGALVTDWYPPMTLLAIEWEDTHRDGLRERMFQPLTVFFPPPASSREYAPPASSGEEAERAPEVPLCDCGPWTPLMAHKDGCPYTPITYVCECGATIPGEQHDEHCKRHPKWWTSATATPIDLKRKV